MASPRSPTSERAFSAAVWIPIAVLVAILSVGILHVTDMITLFWLGALVNVVLSVTKMGLAQIATHPKALMADALHGLGDTVAEVVTALAYTEAARPPDKEHPWGHGKIESVGAVLVTCILLYIAASMGWDSLTTVWPLLVRAAPRDSRPAADVAAPAVPGHSEGAADAARASGGEGRLVRHAAIAVTFTSVLLKEALFKSTLVVGEHAESNLIMASAWHHRSDSLAAGVALASQLGASFGQHYLDPLGGGIVATMLAHSACGSLHESLNDLIDYNTASDLETHSRCGRDTLSSSIAAVQGVRNHTLRTRRMGPYCLVDATIVVDARISASAASMIAEAVHDRVVGDFRPFVTDVQVHVDPLGSPQSHRLETHAELPATPGRTVGPEALEERVREALLSLGGSRPDLPRIAEVTELQTYYYMEEVLAHARQGSAAVPYVDVRVDVRLESEDVSIRSAAAVARAARTRVLAALPGIVRDLDMHLEVEEVASDGLERSVNGPSNAASSNMLGPLNVCAAHSPTGHATHGSWEHDPCPTASTGAALAGSLRARERGNLQRVTLIWDRGPESREARVPAPKHDQRVAWTPVQRSWSPVHLPRESSGQHTLLSGAPEAAQEGAGQPQHEGRQAVSGDQSSAG